MNRDEIVIEDFGVEWNKFQYSNLDKKKLYENFQQYFSIFPWALISSNSEGFDMGCGSGRWAQFVAPKVETLNCVEPSNAINVAQLNLRSFENVKYFKQTTDSCTLQKGSQDFGYCLGVLHHIPNTEEGLKDCAKLLKSGAPFLLYLYYNFENRPGWFRFLWGVSDFCRKMICRLPRSLKKMICEMVAVIVYFPIARIAYLFEKFGFSVSHIPLSDYRNKPFYQMRNDALDRFGTRLEQRFSKSDIKNMLERAKFENIRFSEEAPYWCCVAFKK